MATKDTIAKACRMAVLAVCYHPCGCRVHFCSCLVCLERLQMEGRESGDFEFLCLLFVIQHFLSCHVPVFSLFKAAVVGVSAAAGAALALAIQKKVRS